MHIHSTYITVETSSCSIIQRTVPNRHLPYLTSLGCTSPDLVTTSISDPTKCPPRPTLNDYTIDLLPVIPQTPSIIIDTSNLLISSFVLLRPKVNFASLRLAGSRFLSQPWPLLSTLITPNLRSVSGPVRLRNENEGASRERRLPVPGCINVAPTDRTRACINDNRSPDFQQFLDYHPVRPSMRVESTTPCASLGDYSYIASLSGTSNQDLVFLWAR